MTWQSRGLIKATKVNAHRLKALAVELSEIKLLPLDHQKAQADERGINHTALPAGETVDAAQGEETLRQHHLQLSVYSREGAAATRPASVPVYAQVAATLKPAKHSPADDLTSIAQGPQSQV